MLGWPRSTGKSILCSIVFVFLLFTFNLTLTDSEAQTGTFQVSVAGTAAGSIPHQIDLKVTQLPGGQLSQVTGFVVGPEDVVQVKQGENIIVSTSPDLQVHQVTITNVQGIPVDLAPLPNNVWSLQGLLPGVYTLDVNLAMSSSGILGTFETFLVVLAPNQQPLPPTMVISQITIEQTEECPKNLILTNGNCTDPPTPPVCTPDGPPCPPCPEGVEAGWCADEDERQDVDDCLRPDGTERFPGCSDPENGGEEPRICLPYEGPGGCNYPIDGSGDEDDEVDGSDGEDNGDNEGSSADDGGNGGDEGDGSDEGDDGNEGGDGGGNGDETPSEFG